MRLNSNFQCYFGIFPQQLQPGQQRHLGVYSKSRSPPGNWCQFRTNANMSKSLHSQFLGHQKAMLFQPVLLRTGKFSPINFAMLSLCNLVRCWRSTFNAVYQTPVPRCLRQAFSFQKDSKTIKAPCFLVFALHLGYFASTISPQQKKPCR